MLTFPPAQPRCKRHRTSAATASGRANQFLDDHNSRKHPFKRRGRDRPRMVQGASCAGKYGNKHEGSRNATPARRRGRHAQAGRRLFGGAAAARRTPAVTRVTVPRRAPGALCPSEASTPPAKPANPWMPSCTSAAVRSARPGTTRRLPGEGRVPSSPSSFTPCSRSPARSCLPGTAGPRSSAARTRPPAARPERRRRAMTPAAPIRDGARPLPFRPGQRAAAGIQHTVSTFSKRKAPCRT